jgi:hypothetical protein
MDSIPLPENNTRLGFHYFPDTLHYREIDAQTWIPELHSLGASWLVLIAPIDRAIPESFIKRLLLTDIQPVLHFKMSLVKPPKTEDLKTLLDTYAKWGVNYAILFDRPNHSTAWDAHHWTQEDLVERFLDRFIPQANQSIQSGLIPVFPPLQPGGSYWDTAFMRTSLEVIQRRQQDRLLDKMILSAYGWTNKKSLNWGAGGPERWPGSLPYLTPPGEEDQIGFRSFEWYQAIYQAQIKHPTPMMIFGAGIQEDPLSIEAEPIERSMHTKINLSLAQLINGESIADPENPDKLLAKISADVICCNYWLISAEGDSSFISQAWFQSEGQTLPIVGSLKQWLAHRQNLKSASVDTEDNPLPHPITHYLLIPAYEWGVADWHLDVIRPFVKKYHPTVGFSLHEASYAAQVTVIGGETTFSESDLDHLRQKGSKVERIRGDGTSIATQLAER